ncbi:hypothetical protein [Kitasatospora sp. NPDC056531]|uniref:hypothetical protein n=1 Tax=Kitasatospora sp. NPDC056531 TaxID=3345856 RepID=UPI00369BFA2C
MVCRDHADLTARHPGRGPVDGYGTVRAQLMALFARHADGQPLRLGRRLRQDRATARAVGRLAVWLGVRPGMRGGTPAVPAGPPAPGCAVRWRSSSAGSSAWWSSPWRAGFVLGARPGLAVPEPVVRAEAWQAGATLHAALARHPARTPFTQDEGEDDDQEHGLLGDVRSRVRRRAAGMTLENLQQALHRARDDERTADRYADAGDEIGFATAAAICAEWRRVRDHAAETRAERYDPDHDTALQHALRAQRHRQDVAECGPRGRPPGPADHRRRPPSPRGHRRDGCLPQGNRAGRSHWCSAE